MRKYLWGIFALALVTTVVFAFAIPGKVKAKTVEEPAQTECSDAQKRWFVLNLTCAQQAALTPTALFTALTNPDNYGSPQMSAPSCIGISCVCAILACVNDGQPDFGPPANRYRIYGELQAWVSSGTTHADILLKAQ